MSKFRTAVTRGSQVARACVKVIAAYHSLDREWRRTHVRVEGLGIIEMVVICRSFILHFGQMVHFTDRQLKISSAEIRPPKQDTVLHCH
jgi:hypothetical protein